MIECVAFDYGGTLSDPYAPRYRGSQPLALAALELLRALSASGIRLVLASNTLPNQDRLPALEAAGVDHLFAAVLQSDRLKVAKPDPAFFAHVLMAAACPADRILHVGNNSRTDALGPVAVGMRAALLRPAGLSHGEELPPGAVAIQTLDDVPGLLHRPAEWWERC